MTDSPQLGVYKYCDPSGVTILTSRMIYLTRPRAFNDPFDLKPHYATTMYVTVGRGKPHAISDVQVADAETALKIRNSVVLSFSANPTSLLMWAHYAAGHTGLAIGFDSSGSILAEASPHRLFQRVTYSPDRPSKPTAMQLSDDEVWLTKSTEWEYEEEWRIIDSHLSATEDRPADPDGNRWRFRIRPESVQCVILGCRAEHRLLLDVVTILRSPDYLHVRLFQAESDDRHYRLNLEEIPRAEWPAP
jgi:hypothetical protein